ncbi:MAG: glycosyltransferase family 39 protein [Candidatus Omnitrophota bacterium]
MTNKNGFMKLSKAQELFVLCGVLLISLFLNMWNNDFSFGYHVDEPKKVKFIQKGGNDFHHPLLMLQVVRVANRLFDFKDHNKIVRLGRMSTAVFGVLLILFSYLVFRFCLDKPYALMAALTLAASPIIVIHAHYFKEDIIFTYFAMLSLFFLLRYAENYSLVNGLWLGIATGLALSSQYKGILLIPFYFAIPLFVLSARYRRYFLNLLLTLLVAVIIFCAINYPVFWDFQTFKESVSWNTQHVIQGHDVKMYPWPFFFGFHLVYSLLPGLTWILLGLALSGIIYSLIHWRKIPWQEKILLVYGLLFYFAVELTPMKAFPDFSRHVIPAVPAFVYFAVKSILLIQKRMDQKKIAMAVVAVLCLMILWLPFYDSMKLTFNLNKDTREQAIEWMTKSTDKIMCEQYVFPYFFVKSLADYDVRTWQRLGYTYLVASSFQYERYFFAHKLKGQDEEVYRAYERYKELFNYPYEEIKPVFKTFAFSNPVIRIIDIRRPDAQEND